MRSTAAANESRRNTCEPMWQCSPTNRSTPSSATRVHRAPARRRSDDRSRTSSRRCRSRCTRACAPRRRACTRTSTPAGACMSVARPALRAGRARRSESTTMRPTPAASAARSSSVDLLLPWNTIRSAGNPARSATWSSPPVATSRSRPSSATRRAIAVQRNALLAYATPPPKQPAVLAAPRPGSRLRRIRRAACRTRPRARRGRHRRPRGCRRPRRAPTRAASSGRTAASARVRPRRLIAVDCARSSSSRRAISSGALHAEEAERVGEADAARLARARAGPG